MSRIPDTLRRHWHALAISPGRVRSEWQGQYWLEGPAGFRDVPCAQCRKFDARRIACSVSFGTPLRKCVVAAIEAHLGDCAGQEVLEIGFGRWKLVRNLVRRSGGRWTGIDPAQPVDRPPVLGRGGHGRANAMVFPDASFDRVVGIQTLEHWGQRYGNLDPRDYAECLAEVARVLRPGGSLYLDAPMHFHGHEMFILGDLDRIRALFSEPPWGNLRMERWRLDHGPLARYAPSEKVQREWPTEVVSYDPGQVEALRRDASVWLLTVQATRLA